jgi:N-carbamoylputrescine amidase
MYIQFKVAGVQMDSEVGDTEANVEKACSMIEEAARKGARLVCLPEMFNTGYFALPKHVNPAYWDLAEPLDDSWTLARIGGAAKKHSLYILAPFVEKTGHGIYHNSAALVDTEGKIVGCYRKVHMPWSLTGWEKFYFRPGYDFPVFHTPFVKLGVQICYDRDFPEGFRTLALKGAELILLPAGTTHNHAELWRTLCRARAYENGLFVLGVGSTGKADGKESASNCFLVSPRGELLAALDDEEGILVAEVDLGAIEEARRWRFCLRDRRPEMYRKLTEIA